MVRAAAAGGLAILLEYHGALVVLVDVGEAHVVALSFQEIPGPNNLWHGITDSDQFSFGRAACVYFLSCRGCVDGASA